jgi:WhiB family transcriptional regulator, redox-sensing transcriptional regulator
MDHTEFDSIDVAAPWATSTTTASELLDLLRTRPAWHADAACREHPEVSFFPERGEPTEPAKAICRGCLVRDECAAFADADFAARSHGIWGGTSTRERRAARGRRAAA